MIKEPMHRKRKDPGRSNYLSILRNPLTLQHKPPALTSNNVIIPSLKLIIV
jgi:hypothetical protein